MVSPETFGHTLLYRAVNVFGTGNVTVHNAKRWWSLKCVCYVITTDYQTVTGQIYDSALKTPGGGRGGSSSSMNVSFQKVVILCSGT
jgi:hypothetical protein